jgi:hypothetical protein
MPQSTLPNTREQDSPLPSLVEIPSSNTSANDEVEITIINSASEGDAAPQNEDAVQFLPVNDGANADD